MLAVTYLTACPWAHRAVCKFVQWVGLPACLFSTCRHPETTRRCSWNKDFNRKTTNQFGIEVTSTYRIPELYDSTRRCRSTWVRQQKRPRLRFSNRETRAYQADAVQLWQTIKKDRPNKSKQTNKRSEIKEANLILANCISVWVCFNSNLIKFCGQIVFSLIGLCSWWDCFILFCFISPLKIYASFLCKIDSFS